MRKRNNNKVEESDETLTEEQVYDVLRFAREISGYGNAITPMLLNQRMQDINLNPVKAEEDSLTSALLDPKSNEEQLQNFSQSFELQSQSYKRILGYLSNMPLWNFDITCINYEKGDANTSKFKKDYKLVQSFFDRFDIKKEFGLAFREMLRNETFFCSPRFDIEDKPILQELPSSNNYSKITGRWSYGLLMSFNLLWFMIPGVDLRLYSPFFKKKFNEFMKANSQGYNPALSVDNRGNSSWVYWYDLPVSEGWVFKMTPEISSRVPYFSPLFKDLIQQDTMRNLQKNINMAQAVKLIAGEVPLLKEGKANVADMIAIKSETLGKFLALLKGALSEAIKVGAAPLENLQALEWSENNTMYQTFLRTSVASSGINSNLVFNSDQKPNALESQLSVNVDESIIHAVYPQFNDFLNYWINKETKHFKFKASLYGTDFFTSRAEEFDRMTMLMDKGIVIPSKIANSLGMSVFDLERQIQFAKDSEFVDNLTPILSAFNTPKELQGDGAAGRPQKSASKLGESGAQTRDTGSNIEKGGKV